MIKKFIEAIGSYKGVLNSIVLITIVDAIV